MNSVTMNSGTLNNGTLNSGTMNSGTMNNGTLNSGTYRAIHVELLLPHTPVILVTVTSVHEHAILFTLEGALRISLGTLKPFNNAPRDFASLRKSGSIRSLTVNDKA